MNKERKGDIMTYYNGRCMGYARMCNLINWSHDVMCDCNK